MKKEIRKMNHLEAINAKSIEFLGRTRNNVLMCEGINDGFYGTIEGIPDIFTSQCYELPCSENASVGLALSASAYEVTTIVCFQRVEFALLAIEQFANNAAKNNFLASGKRPNPCLFRLVIGRGWGQGPSHSQSFETMFAQIPEIKVFMPVFPNDSNFILENFEHYTSPTISIEHRWTHFSENTISSHARNQGAYVVKEGCDITIVAYSYNVLLSMKARAIVLDYGISAEVINIFCISDIDMETIKGSIKKTKNLLVLDLDNRKFSVATQILSNLMLEDICLEKAPVMLSNKGVYSPSSPKLAKEYYLSCSDLIRAIGMHLELEQENYAALNRKAEQMEQESFSDIPNKQFIGPF